MDGHAAHQRDVAHDGLGAHGSTATCERHREVANPFNFDACASASFSTRGGQRRRARGGGRQGGNGRRGRRGIRAHLGSRLQLAEPGAHFRPTARRLEIRVVAREPVATRCGFAPGDDVDDLAILQCVAQGHDASVDLGAATSVAKTRVYVVRKIKRRRAARQFDHVTLGRERVDAIGEELPLQMPEKIALGV
jgi:hypothetical protein